jgi:hypothetical protein
MKNRHALHFKGQALAVDGKGTVGVDLPFS